MSEPFGEAPESSAKAAPTSPVTQSTDAKGSLSPSRSVPLGPAGSEASVPQERIGRYQVLEVREVGQHRRLLLAEELDGGPRLAVEVLTGLVGRGGSVFRNQLNRLRRLQHPTLGATLDGGCCEEGPFFVREEPAEPTLEQSALELCEAARVLEAAAQACAVAHRAGLVHGDVRAARIVVGARPQLTGFGAAAVLAAVGIVGSGVTAPESEGAGLSPEADVYALGVLLDRQLATAATATVDVAALVELARDARATRPEERPSAAAFAKRLRRWRDSAANGARSRPARARVKLVALVARASRWAHRTGRSTSAPASDADTDANASTDAS